MKTTTLLALAGLASARFSGFDRNAIDADDVVKATRADYTPAAHAVSNSRHRRRELLSRCDCAPQPAGSGPTASPDTAQGFLNFAAFANAANGASTPSGYGLSFQNLQGSVEGAGAIVGWSTLASYDVGMCAGNCNSVDGCRAFNIYFERDPSLDPGPSCPNPPSTTVIKCILWGDAVSASLATNTGQWRGSAFQVVIAGSNGYTKEEFILPDGYAPPTNLGNASIQAPLDCSGYDTYLGVKTFEGTTFDPSLCAAACTAQSVYNTAHPPINADGSVGYVQTCQFFNTYMLLKNGEPQAQECALYTKSWDASYATNTGQYRGTDHYTISQSYSFANSTNAGTSRFPCSNTTQS